MTDVEKLSNSYHYKCYNLKCAALGELGNAGPEKCKSKSDKNL